MPFYCFQSSFQGGPTSIVVPVLALSYVTIISTILVEQLVASPVRRYLLWSEDLPFQIFPITIEDTFAIFNSSSLSSQQ